MKKNYETLLGTGAYKDDDQILINIRLEIAKMEETLRQKHV